MVAASIQLSASPSPTAATPEKTGGNGAFGQLLLSMAGKTPQVETKPSGKSAPAGEEPKLPRSKAIRNEEDNQQASNPVASSIILPSLDGLQLNLLPIPGLPGKSDVAGAETSADSKAGRSPETVPISDAAMAVGSATMNPATLKPGDVLSANPSTLAETASIDSLSRVPISDAVVTPPQNDQTLAISEAATSGVTVPVASQYSNPPHKPTTSALPLELKSPKTSNADSQPADAAARARVLLPEASAQIRTLASGFGQSNPATATAAKTLSTTPVLVHGQEPLSNRLSISTPPAVAAVTAAETVVTTQAAVETGAGAAVAVAAPPSKSDDFSSDHSSSDHASSDHASSDHASFDSDRIACSPDSGSKSPKAGTGPNAVPSFIPFASNAAASNPSTIAHPAIPSPPSLTPINADQAGGNPGSGSKTPASPADPPPLRPPGASGLQLARIVNGMAQSEMHIGLRTSSFGNVEVHTVVRDSQVGLAVGSEKGDLRTFLTSEVLGLQNSFRQQDLRFDTINFLSPGTNANSGFSAGSNSQSGRQDQRHYATGELGRFGDSPSDAGDRETIFEPRSGLNVQA